MPDSLTVLSSSSLVHTGKGIVSGLIASVYHANAHKTLILYDNTAASGTKILQVEIDDAMQPFVVFFSDRFAPRFATGLYAALDADLVVNLWVVTKS